MSNCRVNTEPKQAAVHILKSSRHRSEPPHHLSAYFRARNMSCRAKKKITYSLLLLLFAPIRTRPRTPWVAPTRAMESAYPASFRVLC